MLTKLKRYFCGIFALLCTLGSYAQPKHKPLKMEFGEGRYVEFMAFVQFWGRITQNNPGSLVNQVPEDATYDISIRRYRIKMDGQPSKHMYFALQIGQNNINYITRVTPSVSLLDAYAEFRPLRAFNIGLGKSTWTGLSRYSAPAAGSELMYDIPMVPLSTVNISDDILRNLGIYVKGQVSKLDYRLLLAKPLNIAGLDGAIPPQENISEFAVNSSSRKTTGYFKWMFFDAESNNSPFSAGTYLGSKKILNIGAGFKTQNRAFWHLSQGDTVITDLTQFSVDVFLDLPLNTEKNTVLTFYTAFFAYEMGPNYLRNIGPNNPIPGLDQTSRSFNGRGNAFPAIGTGQTSYTQAGYLFPRFKNTKAGQLQVVADLQVSDYERLNDLMVIYNLGLNWYIHDHYSKWSLNVQNRPVFYNTQSGIEKQDSKWMLVLQYQFKI